MKALRKAPATRNPVARDLHTPKYRKRIVASAKAYRRCTQRRQASD